VAESAELERLLDERARKRREHNFALVKTLGMVLGVLVTVGSIGTGVAAWVSAGMRSDFERERAADDQAARLTDVEVKAYGLTAAVSDIERVMELERVERAHEQNMLRMILEGQGQTPPDPAPSVQDATARIEAILRDARPVVP